jgi:hypothetical protein
MRQHKLTAISCLGVFVVCGTAWTAPQDQQQNQPDTSAEYNADCEGWAAGTKLLPQNGPEAKLQFRADLRDFHSRHDHKFATEHLARLIVIGEFGHDPAVLAILVPAEPAVGDRFRTQKLKAAQERISLRDLHGLLQQLDLDQALVGPEGFGHLYFRVFSYGKHDDS